MVFSFSVANRLQAGPLWKGPSEGVEKLLGPHNPDGHGLPLTFMGLISRAAGEWVSRQLSFRLDSGPIPAV